MHTTGLMRRIGAVAAVGVAGVTMASAPAFASSPHGQTVTMTEHVHGEFAEPNATNPCTGNTFNGGEGVQFTGNAVNHVTFFTNSDEAWGTFTETGAIAGTDDGTGVSYSGHATAWGNFNMNERNDNNEFTLTIHATGTDGSSITAHETTVFVDNGNGNVTVDFDNLSMTCG
jgi:hypothetical protein